MSGIQEARAALRVAEIQTGTSIVDVIHCTRGQEQKNKIYKKKSKLYITKTFKLFPMQR